jgi:hypothetical protein
MRRARPTIRCLTEDLGLELPELDVDLGDFHDPWLDELRRIAPHSPAGQKRILSIRSPLVFRLRVSNERGATWLDEARGVVWLCAVQHREDGSDGDAFVRFAELHESGRLLPTDDDQLRDAAEAVLRFHKTQGADLVQLVEAALKDAERELTTDLGNGYLAGSWSETLTISKKSGAPSARGARTERSCRRINETCCLQSSSDTCGLPSSRPATTGRLAMSNGGRLFASECASGGACPLSVLRPLPER